MPAVQSLGAQASSLLPGNNFSGDGKKDDLLLNLIKILTDISFIKSTKFHPGAGKMPAVQSLGTQASSLLPGNNFSGDSKQDV
jgi:hypothetical protein